MYKLLVRNLFGLLFPSSEAVNGTTLPSIRPQFFKDTIYLWSYKETHTQTDIKNNKYYRDVQAANRLGLGLNSYLDKSSAADISIIVVPQSYRRWRERGFHHLEDIVKESEYGKNLKPNILTKKTHTKRQTHVDRGERERQQAGTFACRPAAASKLRGTVILFDDVITSGATMNAARAALAPHLHPETKLICLALAH